MIKIIYSNKNRYFKYAKSLQIKKYRDVSNQYLIEGIKIIKEAISFNANLSMVFISSEQIENNEIKNIISICESINIPIYQVDKRIFKEVSETDSSQGIIGIIKKSKYEFNDIIEKNCLKIIILDEIQDPGNLGTIIRTADACNYDCVLLSKGCVDVYNSKSVRATMGSLFHLPIITNIDIIEIITLLKNKGVIILGAYVHDGEACYNIDYKEKFAIIIGNESTGLSKSVLDMIEKKIKIPMPGQAESLNASVAASILMYESIRKRK